METVVLLSKGPWEVYFLTLNLSSDQVIAVGCNIEASSFLGLLVILFVVEVLFQSMHLQVRVSPRRLAVDIVTVEVLIHEQDGNVADGAQVHKLLESEREHPRVHGFY